MVAGVPRMCMSTSAALASAATASMSGSSRPPLTSLTILAPAARAARATAALRVSIDSGTPVAPASRSTTGITRASSTAWSTSVAPGRVDSPPTSSRSAPSSARARPCATAASGSANCPPSENESGVTFTTPITRQRLAVGGSWWPTRRACGATGRVGKADLQGRMPAHDRRGRSPPAHPANRRRSLPGASGQAGHADEVHRLHAGRHAVPELAAHGRGHRDRPWLAHPAHAHAEVLRLDHHQGAARFEVLDELVGDLRGEPLLHLKPARQPVHQPGQLGQPGDLPTHVRDVRHVRVSHEGGHVVFTVAVQRDVADHHHLVVALLEHHLEGVRRAGAQADGHLLPHTGDPRRGLAQAVARQVLADPFEDHADSPLDLVEVEGGSALPQALRLLRQDADLGHRPLAVLAHPQPFVHCAIRAYPPTSVAAGVRLPPRAVLGTGHTRAGQGDSLARLVVRCQSAAELSWAALMPASSRARAPFPAGAAGPAMMPRAGRFTTGARTAASSSLPMVSFSISAATMASATSREVVRICSASTWASAISLRSSLSSS